jgi:uncharacterized membrane protein YebE (DUF533 family)
MSSIFSNYPIENFTKEDKRAYLSAVVYAAASDGFADQEKEIFYLLCSSMGIGHEDCEKIISDSKFDFELFKSSETLKVFAPYLLRDCVAVSYGDFDFSEDERNAIMDIGEMLGMKQKAITYIINAVIGQMNAVKIWSKALNENE